MVTWAGRGRATTRPKSLWPCIWDAFHYTRIYTAGLRQREREREVLWQESETGSSTLTQGSCVTTSSRISNVPGGCNITDLRKKNPDVREGLLVCWAPRRTCLRPQSPWPVTLPNAWAIFEIPQGMPVVLPIFESWFFLFIPYLSSPEPQMTHSEQVFFWFFFFFF